jgi:hypothetical protein
VTVSSIDATLDRCQTGDELRRSRRHEPSPTGTNNDHASRAAHPIANRRSTKRQ